MNVAMYETDGFHQDCTLIGEDVLREAGIETTSAKREGPYTYKRTPKHRSHPYTLRDDMVYQTLRSLTATEIGAGTVNVAKMVGGGSLCTSIAPWSSAFREPRGYVLRPLRLNSGPRRPTMMNSEFWGSFI